VLVFVFEVSVERAPRVLILHDTTTAGAQRRPRIWSISRTPFLVSLLLDRGSCLC
jgi:hypothetical protein